MLGHKVDSAGGMWFEYMGGPNCGQIGWSAGEPPHPVVLGQELLGEYQAKEPPEFCLDKEAVNAWAGKQGKAAMQAGVHRLYFRSAGGVKSE